LELLKSLCCAGRMDKAVEVVDKVLEKDKVCCLSISAGIIVLEWLMNARKLDEVCSLMGRMVDQFVSDTIFCNCIFEEH
jgi:pentatricopeptide repeat protein